MLQHVPGDWVSFDMPGDRSRHSIYDWILVSAALESASGQPFLKFMSERVFNPANMLRTGPAPGLDPGTAQGEDFPLINMVRELIHDPAATRDSTPDPTRRPLPVRVSSYFPRFRSDPKYGVHLMRPIDYSCFAGSSAFVSTPSDLVRFGLALDHGQLLKPATVDLLQSSLRLPTGEETGYALGWQVKTVTLDGGKQARAIGQDGHAMGGMIASLWTLPDHGIVVAVTANVAHADTFSLALKIAESFAAPATRH